MAESAPQRLPGRPSGSESVLDIRRIVETAWSIVDEAGLSRLSTRTLAAALDVKSPALYWHVRSKEELLSLMMEHLLLDSLDGIPQNLDWKEWLKAVARNQHRLLLSHRDSGLIASLAPPSDRLRTHVFERMLAPLLESRLPAEIASAAAGGVASFLLGWIIYEQRPATRKFVEAYHDPDVAFEMLLTSFVNGIAETVAAMGKDADSGPREN
ncbi:MAG: TetR/AcrR family transcriptional regulator C-terminal domain-containing protein [Sphingobium sp.]|nr:TetR/AcrR family transcriptional regulator C-terminal domain-containing protein [Sphingobium sp.]